MNKKRFNLEEALAGASVVNGRGDRVFVTKLALARVDNFNLFCPKRKG